MTEKIEEEPAEESQAKRGVATTPLYMQKFSCIGPDCPDTCCQNWSIALNKRVYKSCKKVQDPTIGPKLKVGIIRNKKSKGEGDYGIIKLNKNGFCPFFTEDRLCGVQVALGPTYLGKVCREYPRMITRVDDDLEMYGTPSCPEVTRLLLSMPDALDTGEKDLRGQMSEPHNPSLQNFIRTSSEDPVSKLFRPLRDFLLRILRNPEWEAWKGLIVLGLFARKAEALLEKKDAEGIMREMASMERQIQEGLYDEELEKFQGNPELHMFILKQVTEGFVKESKISYKQGTFWETMAVAFQGLAYKEEDFIGSVNRYLEADEKWLSPFLAEHKHMMQNYVCNDLLRAGWPSRTGFWKGYVSTAFRYSFIKLLLVGHAAYYKEKFAAEHIIKTVASFGRSVEHNSFSFDAILKVLEERNLLSMGGVAVLLKT